MIFGKISDAYLYDSLNPYFFQLFKFVQENDLSKFSNQRIVLDGDNLYINMVETTKKTAEDQKLEVHREYIDVHFPLIGEETCGITALSDLTVEPDAPFDHENDFAVYSEPARTYFTVRPGEFWMVFPEDAHAPIIGEGTIKKAIAKVRIPKDLPF